MKNSNNIYFTIMDNFLLPSFLCKKMVQKVGVKEYLSHRVNDNNINFDRGRFLKIASLADDAMLYEFLNGLDAVDDVDTIFSLCSLKYFEDYSSYIDRETLKGLIFYKNLTNSQYKKLLNIYGNLVYDIMQDEVNNHFSLKYIDSCSDLRMDIYRFLSMSQIMFIVSSREVYSGYIEELFNIRENEIINYVLNDIKNDPEKLYTYLSFSFPKEFFKVLFSRITITDNFLTKIYLTDSNSSVKECLFESQKEKTYELVMKFINDNTFKKFLTYGIPDGIVEYIAKNINDSQLISVLEESYVPSDVKKILYHNLEDRIIKIIVSVADDDMSKAITYLYNIDDNDISTKCLKKLDISRDDVAAILDNKSISYLEILYKLKKDYVVEYLLKKRKKDVSFFNGSFEYGYSKSIIEDITHDLSDQELVTMFANYHFGRFNKDVVFKDYKDRVLELFKNIIATDKTFAKAMLADCGGTEFRACVVKSFPIIDLLRLDIFNSVEKNDLFSSRYNEFSIALKTLYEEDKYELFKTFLKFKPDDNIFNQFVLSLYSYKDLVDIIEHNDKIFAIYDTNEFLYPRIHEVVVKESSKIANANWDEYILFLKGLRSSSAGLFMDSINSLYLDDQTLNKLYLERGLSDSQKDELMLHFGDDIVRIVDEIISKDRNKVFDYLQKGTDSKILEKILAIITSEELKELLDNPDFVKRKSIGEKFASKLCFRIYKDKANVDIVSKYVEVYKGSRFELVKNFETILEFLKEIKVPYEDFFQYALNGSYNFIPDIVYIYNTHLKDFSEFLDYFLENALSNDVIYTTNLLLLIKNFARYDDLCISITRNKTLNKENTKDVLFLFGREETLLDKPKTIEDCRNIHNLIKTNMVDMFNNASTIEEYKDLICAAVFNCNFKEIINKINNFGSVADLIQLEYYNKNNAKLISLIEKVLPCTSMMKKLISLEDLDQVKEVASNIFSNLDYILEDLSFANYDEKLREIYAYEMENNLTKIDNPKAMELVIDQEKTSKYGVMVYDFSDKEYALLAHVVSSHESYDELLQGKDSPKQNFISFSAISYRNEKYYYNARNIIFGYDSLPITNFVFSSIDNMGSNRSLENNSTEVSSISRKQRGMLEISDTSGNSEVLCLRKNLIPKYIIISGDREPSSEEIKLAKEHNLIICYTKGKGETIENPIHIPRLEEEVNTPVLSDFTSLISNEFIKTKKTSKRRIGILTDAHGLLEPTIAALEDMRLNGIDEIYSLGDNIGTGPNPSEVVDVLKAYNVTSIKGNHELYLENLSKYAKHLIDTNALEEETLNQLWTEENLREDQLPEILAYKDHIDLIVGGKKLLLCHYLKDYNTGEMLFDTHDYDYVFEGHKHFANQVENVYTLRAVGMGNATKEDVGKASYMIIEETDEGINIISKEVKYNYKNTLANINKSSTNTKQKIRRWVSKA